MVGDRNNKMTVGSLEYGNSNIDEDQTYILDGYTVPCNGIVVAWEFCYRISDASPVTFYPGIWRITYEKNDGYKYTDYELIQHNIVTFNPNGTSSNSHRCQKFTLSEREQLIAPNGSVIGLYSNEKDAQPQLLRTDDKDGSIVTFQYIGHRKKIFQARPNDEHDVDYNIAIRVHLSKHS